MKKLTKRLCTVLILVLTFSICLTLVNFAQEATEPDGEILTPNDAVDVPETPTIESQTAFDSFIEVVKTIVGEDFVKMGSMVIEIALLVLLVVLRKTNKTSLTDIVTAVSAKNNKGERVSLAEVVAALNGMVGDNRTEIEAFKVEIADKLKDLTEAYGVQTVTHEQVAELAEATKALLMIFHSVYSNSKTIGVNVKDEEGRIYNEAMKRILALESEDSANDGKA